MDPISDFLTQIRNAQKTSKERVTLPFSRIKFDISKILKREEFIIDVKKIKIRKKTMLRLILKYDTQTKKPAILSLKQISKAGQRIYKSSSKIRPVQGGRGIAIISTSKGIMTDKDTRKQNLGGEVICEIW